MPIEAVIFDYGKVLSNPESLRRNAHSLRLPAWNGLISNITIGGIVTPTTRDI